ncbi:MAG: murein hydrolase activator EnvC family protein [Bdellovibrionia bacterium]
MRIAALLFFLNVTILAPFAATAESISPKGESQFALKEKEEKVLKLLYSLNRNIKRTVSEKAKIENESDYLEASLEPLNREIADKEELIKKQRTYLAKRLKAMSTLSEGGWLKYVLSNQSASDMDRNLRLMGLISKRDQELVRRFKEDLKQVGLKKEKLEKRKQVLLQKQEKLRQQEIKLAAEISNKNKILDKIKKRQLFTQNKIEALRSQKEFQKYQDSSLLDLLTKPSFAQDKGQHLFPTRAGVVKRNFGVVKSPEHYYALKHKGVFIETERGEAAQAVAAGNVMFTGLIQGMGYTAILDHGDHYYSVYSNLDQVLVRVGQEVAKSDVVGKTGYSAMNEASGLHFEIRHFSEAYNPLAWVKGLEL